MTGEHDWGTSRPSDQWRSSNKCPIWGRLFSGANGIRTRDLLLAKSQRAALVVGQMPIYPVNAGFTLKL